MTTQLLRIENLRVTYRTLMEEIEAVRGVSIVLSQGEILGIVGESGSGKSTVALALMGLLDRYRTAVTGKIILNGRNVLTFTPRQWQDIRGGEISMIFQDPTSSLNPYLTVGTQVIESILCHRRFSKRQVRAQAIELLGALEIQDSQNLLNHYPYEFSGGMRQRIMIASALSCEPGILIADEPTSALDVITQARILKLLRTRLLKRKMGVILITHDMGIVPRLCDRVAVMYRGEIVEEAPVKKLYSAPEHEYTKLLLMAVPRIDREKTRRLPAINTPTSPPPSRGRIKEISPPPSRERIKETREPARNSERRVMLGVRNLSVHFAKTKGFLFHRTREIKAAVDEVSFDVFRGEVLGLVGESGSGKSTLMRAIVGLCRPACGSVSYRGGDIAAFSAERLRNMRRNVQMIFQDPFASLNSRFTIGRIIAEPLVNYRVMSSTQARKRVFELMERVQLDPAWVNRYPHEFSGGQCQRISIARALALMPQILLCDEPVSSLDVLIQAEVLNLLKDIKEQMGLTMVFISHDLAVVRHIADRIAVMHNGRIVELQDAESIYTSARHAYTKALLDAVPIPEPPEGAI